jgi:integrating conjugative element protein (TIGR03749 family)
MIKKLTLYCILLVCCHQAFAVEPMQWKSHPLKILLQVGEQRLVHFPDHVMFGRPKTLSDKLDVSSIQGTLYLKATSEFGPTQTKVRLNESGNIVILELIAVKNSGNPLDEVLISVPGSEAGSTAKNSSEKDATNGSQSATTKNTPSFQENPLAGTPFDNSNEQAITPEEMIQFVAREFYAPPRLRINDPRLNRTNINPDEDTTDLFIDKSYGLFDSKPIAAWVSTTGQYITAIRLVNLKSFEVEVNPFHLNMQYNFAAPQHIKLTKANLPGDTTMLYVITDRPFTESRYESPAPWRSANEQTDRGAKK